MWSCLSSTRDPKSYARWRRDVVRALPRLSFLDMRACGELRREGSGWWKAVPSPTSGSCLTGTVPTPPLV
eukprot:gene13658-biopygen11088